MNCQCDFIKNKKIVCIEESSRHYLFYQCSKCDNISHIRYDNIEEVNIDYIEFDKLHEIDYYNKRYDLNCKYYTIRYYPDKTEILIKEIPYNRDLKTELFYKLIQFVYMFKVFIIYEEVVYTNENELDQLIFNENNNNDDDDDDDDDVYIENNNNNDDDDDDDDVYIENNNNDDDDDDDDVYIENNNNDDDDDVYIENIKIME